MNHPSDIDISLLESNLDLTFEERLIQHQRALDIFFEIERAREQLNERSQQSSENFIGK
jgi:hypothetical protein